MQNLILLTDSYKLSHANQYPPNTTNVYSYFESRVGARFPYTTFLGLQSIILDYLDGPRISQANVDEAQEYCDAHMGPGIFNREGWQHIVDYHGGYLPIKIHAVREGTLHPTGTPLMTIENTDPKCWWLTNALETLLTHVWYPSTVATLSRHIKGILKKYLTDTGCTTIDEVLPFMLHDFACRGVTSMESAARGGLGHILNFKGTDTLPALIEARANYGAKTMPAFSVPASEHSTMTSWGRVGEASAYRNMLEQYPTGIVSVVSDSWDLDNAARKIWGEVLKDAVMKRDGKVVIRPDSGNPVTVNLRLVEALAEKFGAIENDMGFKVLNSKIRILQGDGMDVGSLENLLFTMKCNGWAAENWAFGMGGGLMQRGLDRDTQRFAFKCSSAVINGETVDVYKQPRTDPTKNSKRGRFHGMDLVFENGYIVRIQQWEDMVREASV